MRFNVRLGGDWGIATKAGGMARFVARRGDFCRFGPEQVEGRGFALTGGFFCDIIGANPMSRLGGHYYGNKSFCREKPWL